MPHFSVSACCPSLPYFQLCICRGVFFFIAATAVYSHAMSVEADNPRIRHAPKLGGDYHFLCTKGIRALRCHSVLRCVIVTSSASGFSCAFSFPSCSSSIPLDSLSSHSSFCLCLPNLQPHHRFLHCSKPSAVDLKIRVDQIPGGLWPLWL